MPIHSFVFNISSIIKWITGVNSTVSALVEKQTSYIIIPTTNAVIQVSTHASPAYCVLDVLLNKSYGLGRELTEADINLQSFFDANATEADVSSPQKGQYVTSCRGIIEGARSAKEMIDMLLLVGHANLTTLNGLITYIPNGYLGTDAVIKAAATTFNESNIFGGIHKIKFAPSSKVFNKVTATVPVTNSKTREIYSLTVTDDNALAEDNGRPSEQILAIDMAAVELDDSGEPQDSSKEIVEEICRFALRRSRLQIQGSFKINYWEYPNLTCGDVIEVSSKRFNLEGDNTILAKVTRIVLKSDGQETIHWQQYSNLIYDVSQTDITTVTRGSVPEESHNTPTTFDVSGADGASISIIANSGANPGDISTLTVVSTDPNVADQVVDIQPGVAGASADTGITIYRNVNAQPDTPTNGVLTDGSVTTVPTDWTADKEDNGGVTNRWGSRTEVDNEGTAQVEKIVPSGITPTIVAGTKEQGYFDLFGSPGTTTGSPESMVVTFNNETGEIVDSDPVAQQSTTVYSGTTAAPGNQDITEQGFFDISGSFPAANYGTTRDDLEIDFDGAGTETYTFENVDVVDQSYTISLDGFNFPITNSTDGASTNVSTGLFFGSTELQLRIFCDLDNTNVSNQLSYNPSGTPTLFYLSTTATSLTDLASLVSSALQSLSVSGTTAIPDENPLVTTTYDIHREAEFTSDGADIIATYNSAGAYSNITVSNQGDSTSTISNVTGVYQPVPSSYTLTLGGFVFPFTGFRKETGASSGKTGIVIDGTENTSYAMGMGIDTDASTLVRTDEITSNGSESIFRSSTATSMSELASQAAAAYQALAITGEGTTTIKHVTLANTTDTYEVSRSVDVVSSGDTVTYTRLEFGDFGSVTVYNSTDLTSTIENFEGIPEPGDIEYFEVDLIGYTFPITGDHIVGITVPEAAFITDGTTPFGTISLGARTNVNIRTNQACSGTNGNMFYYSDEATDIDDLASDIAAAFQSIPLTSSGSTATLPSVLSFQSTTFDVSRDVDVTSSGSVVRFTYLTVGNKADASIGSQSGNDASTITNTDGEANIPFITYTTSEIADYIAAQDYTGVELTHDNSFDATSNPLTAGHERIKFVYDSTGPQGDVSTAEFDVTQGATGNLVVEDVVIETQGAGNVTIVADTLNITNLDTNNGHASSAFATMASAISGNTFRDAIAAVWNAAGGHSNTFPSAGNILTTSDTAGPELDPTITYTPGSNSTAAVTSSVTLQGAGASSAGTLTDWTAVIRGITYTQTFSEGATEDEQASESALYLNNRSGIFASSSGNQLTVTSFSDGNVDNFTLTITLDGTNQTATTPTVVPTDGSGGGATDSLTLELISGTAKTYDFISGLSTSEVANTILALGYSGVSLVRNDSFDNTTALGEGNARMVFTFNAVGNNTNVTASNFTVTAGGTGGTLEIKNPRVTTEGVADTGITNFSIALDNSISVANLTGIFDSESDKAAQSTKIAERLNTLGVLASGVVATVDGSDEVIVTNKATGAKATIVVTYSGALGTSVDPTVTITTTGVNPGNNTPVWGTPFLDLARALTAIIFPVYQSTSNNTTSVAGQIFPHGSAVMFVSEPYVYVGATTLTTTTSTVIPSSDTTNWKKMI